MAKSDGMPKAKVKKAGNEKRDNYKTRNWVTVIYPESEKQNWRETLRGWCVQAFVSPLHDADKNPDETPKKPHYHVLIMWDGPATRGAMEKRIEELGGVGCQPCNSARGYARYLCHLDNPEKHQYDPAAVEAYGGADYLEVISLESDRRQTIAEMQEWCDKERCISFAELCREARKNHPVWWQALTAHSTMIMFRYVRSLEEELGKEAKAALEATPRPKPAPCPKLTPLEAAEKQVRDLRQRLAEAEYALSVLDKPE